MIKLTPEQRREVMRRQRYFEFYKTDEGYTFKTYGGPFLSLEYARHFHTLEETIDHAKSVVASCDGFWEMGYAEGFLDSWIVDNIEPSGCTIICVCDPAMYTEFLKREGVAKELSPIFQEALRGVIK